MLLDLDDLKRVNETLGHGSGDALIQAAATRLADSVRASDLVARTIDSRPDASVARLGGDEFTILLGSVREGRDAAKVANRIQEAFSKPFVVRGEELIVGTSIGVAIWPSDGSTREELIRNADAAMRHAKQQGGSQLQFYDQSMNAAALHRLRIEGALRRALASNELDAHYQPKVAMASGRICGFEALVRWPKPDGGYVSPAEFVPVAEESGLISKLGVFMLRRACAKAFEWRAAGLGSLPISVNVSPKQFADEGLVDSVASVLAEARIEPAMLELEITESALVHNAVAAETALQRFREMGVGIALDDFGTGYSSLTFLRRFAVDAIKIDRSFVSGIGKASDDEAIVSAVISMAKALRKQVVAEGVETVEQRAFLKGQGCDQEQGYLFSPPRPPDAIEALLREMQSSS
jgi:diguanylate cyclase (GGDEF)-like protein